MNKLKELFSSLFRKIETANDPVAVDEPDLVQKAQRKKLAVIAVAALSVIAAGTFAYDLMKGDEAREAFKREEKPQVKLLQDKLAVEIANSEMEGQLKYLADENKELKETIRKLQDMQPDKPAVKTDHQVVTPKLFIPPDPPSGRSAIEKTAQPSKSGFPAKFPLPQFNTEASSDEPSGQPGAPRLPFAPVHGGSPAASGPGGVSNPLTRPAGSRIRTFGDGPSKAAKQKEKNKAWIPSGSFAKGQLLSGLDAPTGGYSQSDPHPVLIRLTDLAILPGRQRMDIKECFVVGAGYGDLASERAYIRTESLSCVKKDRSTIDMPIKGYVVGEDGKVGMRGRVVSKQGQMLAKALIAGIASGMSDAFKPMTPIYYTSTSGQEEGRMVFPRAEDVLQAGAFGGVSKALDRLSHYYIEAAKQMFPVIEIDAARKVEVVVLKGTEIEQDKQSAE